MQFRSKEDKVEGRDENNKNFSFFLFFFYFFCFLYFHLIRCTNARAGLRIIFRQISLASIKALAVGIMNVKTD